MIFPFKLSACFVSRWFFALMYFSVFNQSLNWTKLLNPKIERITRRIVAVITKVCTAVVKMSVISLCNTNPMIRSLAWITSSSNHHHCPVTTAPVTPEGQVITRLKIAAAWRLAETHRGWITTSKVWITGSSATIAVPNVTISEITKAGYKASEGVSSDAVIRSVQQICMRAVITARNFDMIALNEPECRWYHVIVVRCNGITAISCFSVIPPVAAVLHPVKTVSIGEAWNECPSTIRHVTVHLRKKMFLLYHFNVRYEKVK